MTAYSDAAKTYALANRQSQGRQGHRLGCICTTCEDNCRAFDAGAASAVPAVPAPVLLTDPDDPRIKNGAMVRYVLDTTISPGTWGHDVGCVSGWVQREDCTAYLIAEAPDPIGDLVDAFRGEFDGLTTEQDFREVVHLLTISGYEITKTTPNGVSE
jgi:hypothetical protein